MLFYIPPTKNLNSIDRWAPSSAASVVGLPPRHALHEESIAW